MIFIALALLVSVTARPDYYAVKIKKEKYKIFTKISECKGPVYQSGDRRVLFEDEVWKIGTLTNDLDCNTLSSVVDEEYYRTKSRGERPELEDWYDMNDDHIWITFEHLYKRKKKTLVKLVGGTKLDDKSEEDCLSEVWGEKFPDKDIVVAFQDSNCFYDFVDQAQLDYSNFYQSATLFVHPAGRNINNQLKLQL